MRSLRVKLYESSNQNSQHQYEGEQSRDEEMEKFINDLLTTPEVLVKGGVNSRIGKSIKYLLRHQKVSIFVSLNSAPICTRQTFIR